MNILVTGGAGYIGSHTANLLYEKGYDVVVIDDLSTGFQESLNPKIQFFKGSVLDQPFLNQVLKSHKFDAVIHFAAKLLVPESVSNPLLYYTNNVVGSLNVFTECISSNIPKIIFSSTAAVYGEPKGDFVIESDLCNPINPYGQSKLAAEKILQDLSTAHKLKHVILRYFNVAGSHPDLSNGLKTKNATHLVKIASEAAVGKREKVEVYGTDYPTDDGTCIRDYIHILDLAHAHISALEYLVNGGASDIFNCGYGKGYSVSEVLRVMKEVSGKNFTIADGNRRAGDPAVIVSNNKKIFSALKWKPQYDDLRVICKTAYEWEKKLV